MVYSGDTGFYSGCRSLIPLLEENRIPCTVCAGVSSVQLLAAALHRPWQDWVLVSAHGVHCDAVTAVSQGKPAFFLTGGSLGVPQLCSQLCAAGLGDLPVTVGKTSAIRTRSSPRALRRRWRKKPSGGCVCCWPKRRRSRPGGPRLAG